MSDTQEMLKSANMLFLKKYFKDAISIYEKIIEMEPNNLNAINNKGYALSKIKDFENAINCYDIGLKIKSDEMTLLINKISTLRKMNSLDSALNICNSILIKTPHD